jgi:hypothetical protein
MAAEINSKKIAKLRVILDTEQDVYRDIEIYTDSTLLHFHNAILDSFGWASGEMASFFESDESWDKGKEYSLMDIGGDGDMTIVKVEAIIKDTGSRAVYVYDFLRMWCFYIEPVSFDVAAPDVEYPQLCLEFGTPPSFDSKDGDLAEGMGFEIPNDGDSHDSGDGKPEKTGDPDIDAYLEEQAGEDDSDGWNEDHASLDGLDELM